MFRRLHHGGQLLHGGTQGGVIHQAGAEIKILKLLRAHGGLLGHSFRRPAQPAPPRVADAPLGNRIHGLHGNGHIPLGNGRQFKSIPPAADFNIGVHLFHFRQAVAADDAVLFFRGSGKHFPVQPGLVQAQEGQGARGAHLPDERYSHFLRNIR